MAEQKVRWAYAARADLLEALEYLVEHSPTAAASFLQQVDEAAQSLIQSPERGSRVREVDVPGLRQLIVGRHRLIYRVEEGSVGVARFIHGSRDFREAWRKPPR